MLSGSYRSGNTFLKILAKDVLPQTMHSVEIALVTLA